MKHALKRATTISEALPYIIDFFDKIVVIKYGGSAMIDDELKARFLRDVVLLKYVGMHPIIVHGGGPAISKALKRRKIETRFVQGLRYTSKEVMQTVEHVLGKKINQEIVALLKKNGAKAKGFYGKKGRVILARKSWVLSESGKYVDLGFTGHPVKVRSRVLWRWMKKGHIPVIAPIGIGPRGRSYNINADTAAAAVAEHLKAEKLMLFTDVRGVLGEDKELISKLTSKEAKSMIKQGVISGGMIPKVKCCLHSLKHGAHSVHIIDGRVPHAMLLEIFTNLGIGTMVVK
ncbi:MAG: acetylglutamate kinase [bacterium]